jgi:hypothetical protein
MPGTSPSQDEASLISSSAANAFPRAPPAAMIVSRLGPENAPSSDIFGHNRQRRCFHENDGGHNDFGVAHDIRSRHFGSDADQRSERDANYQLKSLWGAATMLSVDQFLRLISVPAVIAAFLIASQVSGAGIFNSAPPHYASK